MDSAIQVIAVIRDLVIILSALTVTVMAVIVGRVVLRLTRTLEDMSGAVKTTVTTILNPLKGVRLIISRAGGGPRKQ